MDTEQQIKERVDLITSEIKNDLANEMEERLATMQALLNKSLKEVKNIQDDTKNQGQRATYATGSRFGAVQKRFNERRDERRYERSDEKQGMTEGRNIRPKQKPFSVRPNEKHFERSNERVVERREARQSNPEWKRLASDKSGLDSIRRRLNHFGTDPIAFGQCLHFIKEETLERLKNTKFGIQRMTIDSKPSTQFRPCQFYQSDQCRQTIYSNVHLDTFYKENKKAYVHGCSLCYKLSFVIVEHAMYDCTIVAELDRKDENKSYNPTLLGLATERSQIRNEGN